jgi:hypothetical protein
MKGLVAEEEPFADIMILYYHDILSSDPKIPPSIPPKKIKATGRAIFAATCRQASSKIFSPSPDRFGYPVRSTELAKPEARLLNTL